MPSRGTVTVPGSSADRARIAPASGVTRMRHSWAIATGRQKPSE